MLTEAREKVISRLVRLRRVDPVTNCWEFNGAHTSSGYAEVSYCGNVWYAHRLIAYFCLNLGITDTRFVCHKCDNPGCWNPVHLFLGTNTDNMSDASRKGRVSNGFISGKLQKVTHCKYGHEFTESNTINRANGKRVCKECNKEKCRLQYLIRKARNN